MRNLLGIVVLCAAVALAGCQVDPSARTVREYKPGGRTAVAKAQYYGEYSLYQLPDRAASDLDKATPPIVTVHLQKGQWLGFKLDQQGQALAVAGDQTR